MSYRVLITGSDGYIGAVLSQFLTRHGHMVVGVDAGFYQGSEFSNWSRPPELLSWNKYSRIEEILVDDLRYFDVVVHLAGLSNDPLGQLAPETTLKMNGEASILLAEKARKAKVRRFIFASSCSVYGASGTKGVAVTESFPTECLTAYAKSKIMAEQGISALATPQFSPTFLRNANVYGASPSMRTDLVVNNLVGSAFLTNEIVLQSDGQAWRPLIHVHDLAEAIHRIMAANLERVHDEIFNVGNNAHNFKIIDIADAIVFALPHCVVKFKPQVTHDNRSYRVDFSKLKHALEWEPQIRLSTGVRELFNFYAQNLLSDRDFNVRLVRLAWLKERQVEV